MVDRRRATDRDGRGDPPADRGVAHRWGDGTPRAAPAVDRAGNAPRGPCDRVRTRNPGLEHGFEAVTPGVEGSKMGLRKGDNRLIHKTQRIKPIPAVSGFMSDQTQPKRIAELEDRIEQLEATTKKMMPTRRDALKYGGAAALGAAAMSGTASAGSAQVGTIGDASNLVDIEAEDVNVSDTINGASVSGAAAGEALTSDGAGGLTFAEAGGGVPPNFSYNDVKNSRSLETTFTNNTGKALFVCIIITPDSNNDFWGFHAEVNGSKILEHDKFLNTGEYHENHKASFSFFVPDGGDYYIGTFAPVSISEWHEAEM